VTVPQIDRRQALKLFAALGAAGVAAACASEDAGDSNEPQLSDDPVRIGLVAPQTGPLKVIGDDLVNGFQLYLQLNQNRLGGHPVQLVTADEGADAKSAKGAVDSLISQSVLAFTGVANSSALSGVRDTVEDAKVPLIATNGVPGTLEGVKYIWSASFVDNEPSLALGGYLTGVVRGNQQVAVVAPSDDTGRDAVDKFRQTFGTDQRLIETFWTAPTIAPNKDFFRPTLGQLRSSGADVVYAFYTGPAAVEFVKQFHSEGLEATIYGPGGFTEGTALEDMGEDAKGIFTAMNYSADLNNAANRLFATAYQREHDMLPSASAMASYDAAQVLDRAIRLCGGRPTAQQVNLMLGRVGQIDSPRGTWQFNQPRRPQQKWYLREVRPDGQVLSNVLLSELATLG
jgi:branched-chain amino acid transport system substrate-binding protein